MNAFFMETTRTYRYCMSANSPSGGTSSSMRSAVFSEWTHFPQCFRGRIGLLSPVLHERELAVGGDQLQHALRLEAVKRHALVEVAIVQLRIFGKIKYRCKL